MAIIGEWIRRLTYLVRRHRRDEELRLEMEAHRALMVEPHAFGNEFRLLEEARNAWGWAWLDDLVQDTRVAFRTLRRSPGFTLAAIATLALGIGVNAGMFSLVNAMLLRPQDDAANVVGVHARSTEAGGGGRGFSYPNYGDLRDATTGVFEHLAAHTLVFVGVDAGDGAGRAMAAAVTANYFQTLGRQLALGRSFTALEERRGGGIRVAIVSHRFWQLRGSDPGFLGQMVRINGEPFTVIGVAPQGFTGTSVPGPALWLPLGAHDAFSQDASPDDRGFGARDAHALSVVGRLRADQTIESAGPAVAGAARQLASSFPDVNSGYTFALSTPSPFLVFPGPGGNRFAAMIAALLMVMPGIVLLVACLNLADLLLARGVGRRQELAIRASLGAGRGRLTRQMLTEGLLLALVAGAVGLVLSSLAANGLVGSIRPRLPFAISLPEPSIDWRVILATAAFGLTATLIFGAAPAWSLSGRAGVADLRGRAADDGGRRGGFRMGNVLVVGQVAMSLLLIACGGLFVMSAVSAASADPGFPLDGRLLVEVDPELAGYDEPRAREVLDALVDRLRAVPGVEAVTLASGVPFTGFGDSRDVAPAGSTDESPAVGARFMAVGRDHARTLGLPIRAGRDFSEAELSPNGSAPVAIVDDVLAQRLWGDDDALGRMIQFHDGGPSEAGRAMRVVGIVPAVNHSLGTPRPFPHVYVPLGQYYQSAMILQLLLAGGADEERMLSTVIAAIRAVDERMPVLRAQTWRDHLDASLDVWIYRTGARMFAVFGAIALLLATVGVYGVKSYLVSRRTREFGIRIATGADPRALLWQVLREGGRITAAGIALGLVLAVGAGQLLQGFLYGVNAVEPVVFALAPLILLASSLLASYLPALRATKADPIVALRSD